MWIALQDYTLKSQKCERCCFIFLSSFLVCSVYHLCNKLESSAAGFRGEGLWVLTHSSPLDPAVKKNLIPDTGRRKNVCPQVQATILGTVYTWLSVY